jgi:hypothetical protein
MFKQFSLSVNKMFNSKNQITNLAHNKFVLYFLLLVSLANLYYLVMNGEHMFAVIFILVGFVTSFFSKNMIIILFIAVCITSILKCGGSCIKEGFDGDIVPEDVDAISSTDETSIKKTKPAKKGAEPANEDAIQFMKTVKSHADELLTVQNELADNMVKIDPLLTKVSQIMDKMEKLKSNNGDVMDKIRKYETDTTIAKK